MRIVNKNAYPNAYRQHITLSVECFLEGVPGAFNQIEDHMKWICQLPYVAAVAVAPPPPRDPALRLAIATLYLRYRAAREHLRSARSPEAARHAAMRADEAWNALQATIEATSNSVLTYPAGAGPTLLSRLQAAKARRSA